MSVNDSSPPTNSICSNYDTRVFINTSFFTVKAVVILPPCTFIVYRALQRWRQQRSFSSVSHGDIITFHLAAMELFWGPGLICALCKSYVLNAVVLLGSCCFAISLYGEILFHVLTCVDRYLAVVHPVLYLQMKSSRGVKVRTISITVVWLICLGLSSLESVVRGQQAIILILCILAFSIIVVTFCNVCVLCVLIRPGPGQGGGAKERDSQKQRAFRTITAIWVVLWLWFVTQLISNSVSQFPVMSVDVKCVLFPCLSLLNLPVSLLLPVLYLSRTGNCRP